jgi:hypothetical protein
MANEGTGATITFGTTGVSLQATSIQSAGISWASIDTTYLGTTTAKTYIRGDLYDPGTITVNFLTDPDSLDTLIGCAASETITITYTDTPAATEASTGFVMSIDPSTHEVDTVVSGSLTVKRTGAVTFADGT